MKLAGLSAETLVKVNAVFAKHPEVEEVILYGSRALGNYEPASDIDLTLKGDKLNLTIQQQIELQLYDLLIPYKFDLSLYDKILNEDLKEHIRRVGKVFYRRVAD